MLVALQILTTIIVAVAMALALAHALEFPGKMRLSKEQYLTVQPIYYPGFTFAGIAEPLGLILLIVLLIFTASDSPPFWLVAGALASLLAMHATYWLMTHPVNNFWLENIELKGMSSGFFSFDPIRRRAQSGKPDWTQLRDRWELSHVVRAWFGMLCLVLLVTALTT